MRLHEFKRRLRSTYIGPFVVAMFVIGTIQAFIATVRDPLSLLLTNFINGLPKRGLFVGMGPLPSPTLDWQSTLQISVSTLIFATIAILLGRWLYGGRTAAIP